MAREKSRARPAKSKADKRSAIQRSLDNRAAAHRADWARRHPEAASAERALRRANAQLRERWKHKNEGTPETHDKHARRQDGVLVRLYRNGTIDAEQLASAVEIACVAERIAGDVAVRTASLETRVDMTRMGDGSFYERLGWVRREVAYTRWRAELPAPAPVLEMLVGEPVGFTVVAQRHGMHNRRARRLLLDALDLWPQVLGAACKEIDRAALDRVHSRLAA
jgi:hypothetical protein